MLPFAHIAGIPVEETLGALGPAATVLIGMSSSLARSRWRRARARLEDRGRRGG
jgi:hypothetical protein